MSASVAAEARDGDARARQLPPLLPRRRPYGLAVDEARGVLYAFTADAVIRRVDLIHGFTSVLAGGNGTNIFSPVVYPYPVNYPTALVDGVGTRAAFGVSSGGGLALATSADVLFVADSE